MLEVEVLAQARFEVFVAEVRARWQVALEYFMGALHGRDVGLDQALELHALIAGKCLEPLRQRLGQGIAAMLLEVSGVGLVPSRRYRHRQCGKHLLTQFLQRKSALCGVGGQGVVLDQFNDLLLTGVELIVERVLEGGTTQCGHVQCKYALARAKFEQLLLQGLARGEALQAAKVPGPIQQLARG